MTEDHHEPAYTRAAERLREGVIMALYVALVLLAALVALPSDHDTLHGDLGLLAIIWGTAIGLALTHWFAFVLAAASLNGGAPSAHDRSLAVSQLLGATAVAAVTSIPVLLAKQTSSLEAATFAPAAILGVAGFGVVRARGWSRFTAVLGATLIATLGVIVAAVKVILSGH